MSKVTVESTVSGIIVLDHPAIGVKTWERKGTKKILDFDALQEAMYDDGVRNIFNAGILYIKDMEQKKDLDLEPIDAKEPTNIIVFSPKEMEDLLKTAPLAKFKEQIAKISEDQIREMAHMAIELKINHMDKCKVIQDKCGIDVINSIRIAMEDAAE